MTGALADRHDLVALDLDGVVYAGDRPVRGAPEALAALRERGTRLLFLTNNSARTPDHVAARLTRMGVAATPGEVLTSAQATAGLLEREGLRGASAFLVGERGILEALRESGIEVLEGTPDRADLVVVGWDRQFDYAKFKTAALLIERGARLVATNGDVSYPGPDGRWPGAGAILAGVVAATGATATVVGKPGRPMFEAATRRTAAERPLMVGDRLDTDISGAARAGWESVLVLTGISGLPDLPWADDLPTHVADDLGALLEDRPTVRFRPAASGDGEAVAALLRSSGLDPDRARGGPGRPAAEPVVGAVDGEIVATAAASRTESAVVVWSVAVAEAARAVGLGALAVSHALALARSGAGGAAALPTVYLFTQGGEPFFERLGFRAVGREALPPAVRDDPRAGGACSGATAMRLSAQAS